jgi:hypothetical protein
MIVQLLFGGTTEVAVQVPPVIENVPPGVPTLTTAGAAVMVSDPFAVAELLTVIVAVSFTVLGVVGASVGVGAEMVTAAPCTVNAIVLVFPIGVVRPRFLTPVVAVPAIARLAVTWDELTTFRLPLTRVTPAERPVTAVVPVRLVPVNVTGTVVFKSPAFGAIEVSVAPCTVNGRALLAAALPFTETVTLCGAVVEAFAAMVKVAVAVVELVTVKPLMVMPPFVTAMVV